MRADKKSSGIIGKIVGSIEIAFGIIMGIAGIALFAAFATEGTLSSNIAGLVAIFAIAILLPVDGIKRYRRTLPWYSLKVKPIKRSTYIIEFSLSAILGIAWFAGTIIAGKLSMEQEVPDDSLFALPILCLTASIILLIVAILQRKKYKKQSKNTASSNTIKSNSKIPIESWQFQKQPKAAMSQIYNFETIKRDFEILKDSFEISQTTNNTETFCMRYKLCMEKALSLRIACNSGFKMSVQIPDMIESVLNAKDALRLNFLFKGIGEQITGAEVLKTNKGKIDRYTKILNHLENNEVVFVDLEEYNSVCDKIRNRIAELSPFTAKNNIIKKNDDIPNTGYDLSTNEARFFTELLKALEAVGLNKNYFLSDKLASGMFNLTYDGIYLGKFGETITPEKFKVMKFGAQRATRVFHTKQEADDYLIGKVGYEIIHIEENCVYDMQIIEDDDFISVETKDFDECLSQIPGYAKYAKKIYKQWQKL